MTILLLKEPFFLSTSAGMACLRKEEIHEDESYETSQE